MTGHQVLPRRGILAAVGTSLAGPVLANTPRPTTDAGLYPARPVTMVLPFAVGGSNYFIARALSRRLAAALGQPFSLDVRLGQSGLTAMAEVAFAPPDGYTLVLSPGSTFGIALHSVPPPFSPERDFAPVGLVASSPLALCVHVDSGFRTLSDLLDAARLAPDRIRYASAGVGATQHMATELFAHGFGVSFGHQPFTGEAPAMYALTLDQVQFAFLNLSTAIPGVAGGTLRALAVTAPQRVPQLPMVPTLAEAGLPGFHITSDFVLLAPAGTPEPILARLSAATRRVMAGEDMRQLLAPLGMTPMLASREEFPAYLQGQAELWLSFIAREQRRP